MLTISKVGDACVACFEIDNGYQTGEIEILETIFVGCRFEPHPIRTIISVLVMKTISIYK